MVLALATAAFAVEVSYEGKVAVTWGGESQGDDKTDPAFAEDALEAKVQIDFTKDYGDGVSAGVTTKVEAHGEKTLEFDGAGWVQLERDLFTLKASTEIDAGAGKDLGEFNIPGKPGLGLDLNLVDGLTINTVVNAGEPAYNYVLKGEFAQDLFTIGGGFQSAEAYEITLVGLEDGEEVELTVPAEKTTAFGIYGTANLIDGLTLNAEFGSRKIEWGEEGAEDWESTALLASAAYEVDALSATGTFLMQKGWFKSLNDDDADQTWRIIDMYRYFGGDDGLEILAFALDASYDLIDALTLEGYFDYLLSAKYEEEKRDIDDPYAYKVGAAYTIIEPLEAKAWYKAVGGDLSQFGGSVAYTLAEDVTASFEVTSTTDTTLVENADAKLAYTAKIEAAF
jgi:hypothetical protein